MKTTTNPPGLRRVMYCITSKSGQFLINLASDGPVFSPMASEALATRHAWMNSATAVEHLRETLRLFPGVPLGIGLLDLEATTPGNWRVASTQCYGFTQSNEPLIS